jgi:hypothetical protein
LEDLYLEITGSKPSKEEPLPFLPIA